MSTIVKTATIGQKIEVDENGVLHHYVVTTYYPNQSTKIDILPKLRQAVAEAGGDDFCFINTGFGGAYTSHNEFYGLGGRYDECPDAYRIEMELQYGRYRSLEAKRMLENLLMYKFGYKWFGNRLITGDEYNKIIKAEKQKNALIGKVNAGEEVTIRINEEITHFEDDKNGYHACWCTCKEARGVNVDIRFADGFTFKPYNKKYYYYFHVLDKDGNKMKTRNHYCRIKGHVEMDENGNLINQIVKREGRVTIVIDGMELI